MSVCEHACTCPYVDIKSHTRCNKMVCEPFDVLSLACDCFMWANLLMLFIDWASELRAGGWYHW